MKMSRKGGMIVFIIGLVLLGASFYIRSQVAQAKEHVTSKTNQYAGNTYGNIAGKIISGKVDELTAKYENIAMWCTIAGIAGVVLGGYSAFSKKKNRR
ncbi:MAG: hypothetical protein JSS61_00915 [Verrucomicrobia bacterium]|nr:hypothetical protein [Verrucomicrobiota bacterium]